MANGRAEVTLPPGLYGVAVAREGYRGASGSIALLAGDHKTLSAPLKRVKNRGGAAVGVLFTLLAAGGEGVAIAGHVLADRSVVGTPDYDKYHQMELYGQIGAGCAAGVALVSFLLDIITNRGRVDEGPAYDLVPAATGAAP